MPHESDAPTLAYTNPVLLHRHEVAQIGLEIAWSPHMLPQLEPLILGDERPEISFPRPKANRLQIATSLILNRDAGQPLDHAVDAEQALVADPAVEVARLRSGKNLTSGPVRQLSKWDAGSLRDFSCCKLATGRPRAWTRSTWANSTPADGDQDWLAERPTEPQGSAAFPESYLAS